MKWTIIEAIFIAIGLLSLVLFVKEVTTQRDSEIYRTTECYDDKILENAKILKDLKVSVELEK